MKNICEWENCSEEGKFKAPIEKDNSKKFRLLCLSHIKQFNKSWNYFANMSQTEIEYFLKSDTVWHKPTKKFSSADNFFKILWNNVLDEKYYTNLILGSGNVGYVYPQAGRTIGLEIEADF